jgi:uncharacterized protein YidB (DUF937 family)
MGFLEGLLKQATGGQTASPELGNLMSMVSNNPQIVSALTALLSSRDSSVGGTGGLAGLVGAFQKHGLGDMIHGWISTGPNPPISPAQVTQVLGHDTVNDFATKAGVPASEASSVLAHLLPTAVDHLTPDGNLPATNTLENALGSLLKQFGQ